VCGDSLNAFRTSVLLTVRYISRVRFMYSYGKADLSYSISLSNSLGFSSNDKYAK
jgi:hypothetical protein